MLIDWDQVKTAEEIEKEKEIASTIIISRRAGLFWLYDNLKATEEMVYEEIRQIPDPDQKYKAKVSFDSAYWHSNDPYVAAFGAELGLDTPEKLRQAFLEASGV